MNDYQNIPKLLRDVIDEGTDVCKEHGLGQLSVDIMAYVLLQKKEVIDILKKNNISHTAILAFHEESILKQQQLVNSRGFDGFPEETILPDNDSAVCIAKIIVDSRFSENNHQKLRYIDILGVISEISQSIMNEILKETPQKIIDSVFMPAEEIEKVEQQEEDELIEEFCTNYTQLARDSRLDQVIGRDVEIQEVTEILARRKKNNVMLLGAPGVGKTALVEGLAINIVNETAPEILHGKEVLSLEVASILAGTKYRGEFEERVKKILNAVVQRGNSIIFIDEVHTVMGAGSSSNGSVDLANIMKPMLARGELSCIGTTTFDEYKKTIQKDKAMVRRFQNYTVREPSIDHVKEILTALAPRYSEHHGVNYPENFVDEIVDLSTRYIPSETFPDKAINILDGVGAYVRVHKRQEATLDDLKIIVARMAGIPVNSLKKDVVDVFDGIDVRIKSKLYNQDHVVDKIIDEILVSKAGLKEDNKPVLSTILLGSSGVGKTETCRLLSKELQVPLIKFDMSEFQESHSVSKLIGAPPGYAGYDEHSAKLIDEIEQNPNCILLLDEIEKAHPKVLDIFLQAMDDARLTSSQGKEVRLNNVIIVMTSNLGAKSANAATVGFKSKSEEDTKVSFQNELEKFFRPEFVNRLNSVLVYNNLDQESIHKIVYKEIDRINNRLAQSHVVVEVDEKAVEYLAKEGFSETMGARPLQRVISEKIKTPLSKKIVYGELKDGGKVVVTLNDQGEIDYIFS